VYLGGGIINLPSFIGRNRARLNRLWGLSGMIMGIVNVFTFSIVQKDLTGFPVPVVVAVVLSVVIGIPFLVVWYEEKSGAWGDESKHIWALAGWDPDKLSKDVEEIKGMLKNVNR
jgi:hypothetical protein